MRLHFSARCFLVMLAISFLLASSVLQFFMLPFLCRLHFSGFFSPRPSCCYFQFTEFRSPRPRCCYIYTFCAAINLSSSLVRGLVRLWQLLSAARSAACAFVFGRNVYREYLRSSSGAVPSVRGLAVSPPSHPLLSPEAFVEGDATSASQFLARADTLPFHSFSSSSFPPPLHGGSAPLLVLLRSFPPPISFFLFPWASSSPSSSSTLVSLAHCRLPRPNSSPIARCGQCRCPLPSDASRVRVSITCPHSPRRPLIAGMTRRASAPSGPPPLPPGLGPQLPGRAHWAGRDTLFWGQPRATFT